MKGLELPSNVKTMVKTGNTGELAGYIQRKNPRWSAADCYQAAVDMINKQNND